MVINCTSGLMVIRTGDRNHPTVMAALLPVVFGLAAGTQHWAKMGESCYGLTCLEARLDVALDRALAAPSLTVLPGVTLDRRASPFNYTTIPVDPGDILDKLSFLLDTRNVNIHLSELSEARGKKKKKYGELVYVCLLIAAFVLPLKVQALAVVAGKALLMAKLALYLSGSVLLKKLAHQDGHSHRRSDLMMDVDSSSDRLWGD